jgi:hypothetical protein
MPAFFTTWNPIFYDRPYVSFYNAYQTVKNKEGLNGVLMDTSTMLIVNPMIAPNIIG